MTNFKTARFADPTVDFAFKRIFGTEQYKAATVGLLNSLITDHHIVDVEYPNVELVPDTEKSRKAVIDIICTDDTGSQFIVEMQRAPQTYFRERMVFYASKLISRQEDFKGDWDFHLAPLYVIAFINFSFGEEAKEMNADGRFVFKYVAREEVSGRKMPGSTEYYFLQIDGFNKKPEELVDKTEKWLYLLRSSKELKEIPEAFGEDESFETYFSASERASFTAEEEARYLDDMVTQRDIDNSRRQAEARAHQEGLEEGRVEGRQAGLEEGALQAKLETARKLKAEGLDVEMIIRCTGLSKNQVEVL